VWLYRPEVAMQPDPEGRISACRWPDRLITWAGQIPFDFQTVKSDVLAANDYRFGRWQHRDPVGALRGVGQSRPTLSGSAGCAP